MIATKKVKVSKTRKVRVWFARFEPVVDPRTGKVIDETFVTLSDSTEIPDGPYGFSPISQIADREALESWVNFVYRGGGNKWIILEVKAIDELSDEF